MSLTSSRINFVDAKGQKGGFSFVISADTPAHQVSLVEAILAASLNLTNAVAYSLPNTWDGLPSTGALGNTGSYQDITIKAVMTFVDLDGQIHRYEIPAPKTSIFKPDLVTVDPGNTDVATWAAVMTATLTGAHVTSKSGINVV
ncbi:MAG TPA: hypothetical protein VN648_07050, partial [Candidatus Methylomirabilis sp.]|nr:hypothetical protein [Candidatus Methylomirabilis sp.]